MFMGGFREKIDNELSMKDSTDEARNKEDSLGEENEPGNGEKADLESGHHLFSCAQSS